MTSPLPHVSTAPSTDTQAGNTWPATVTLLPINAGDPVWVRQDGTDSDMEAYMSDDYIAQVGDRVMVTQSQRGNMIICKIAPQPGWNAMSPLYGANVTDFGTPFDIGAYIKMGSIVYLRGLIKTTALVAQGSVVFTMPTGYGMNRFDSSGSVTFGGLFSTGSLTLMRFQVVGYQWITANALASGSNVGLTGISYPADI